MRLHTDGDPDEHVLDHTLIGRDAVEELDLRHRVEHDVSHSGTDRHPEFVGGLVVAVDSDPLRREVCA